jgi:hypothetical protein
MKILVEEQMHNNESGSDRKDTFIYVVCLEL